MPLADPETPETPDPETPDPAPPAPGPPPTGESLADLAYRRIEDLVVTMELAPGARVSEHGIAERIGVGRTPVREALQRLAGDGILVTRPRRGMRVREIDLATQLRVLEARRALEGTLVRRAALRRSPEQAARLRETAAAFRRMRDAPDPVPALRHDRRFVDLLLDSADNPFLASIIPLYALSRRFWLAHYARQVRFEPGAITDFHIRIGEAVAAGEEAEAGRLADAFLDHVEAFARFVGLDLAASS